MKTTRNSDHFLDSSRSRKLKPMTLYQLVACTLIVLSAHGIAGLVPVDLRCDGQAGSPAAGAVPRSRGGSSRRIAARRSRPGRSWSRAMPRTLAEEKGDLWDSGKMAAGRSPFVRYAGKPLAAGQRCHWKVRCWDAGGQPSAWSEPAVWEVAPQSPADWQGARWIDDGRANPSRDEDFYQPDPAPLLRREFTLAKPVVRARLHVAGLGLCYASLNGERLTDQVLDPPWTAFDKRILFRTHDVTAQLTAGHELPRPDPRQRLVQSAAAADVGAAQHPRQPCHRSAAGDCLSRRRASRRHPHHASPPAPVGPPPPGRRCATASISAKSAMPGWRCPAGIAPASMPRNGNPRG